MHLRWKLPISVIASEAKQSPKLNSYSAAEERPQVE
jgi:hypothetical protein